MKSLPVNLATNPYEHRQWVRRITLTSAAVVAVLTVAHLAWGFSLRDEPQSNEPDRGAIELLRQWDQEVDDLAAAADPEVARRLSIAVGLSNLIIDQRVFPWGTLFTMLEESMPDDVRLELVQPTSTLDGVRVALTAASESGDSLLAFLSALEQRPEFIAVYPGRQLMGIDGELRLSIEALVRGLDGNTAVQEPRP